MNNETQRHLKELAEQALLEMGITQLIVSNVIVSPDSERRAIVFQAEIDTGVIDQEYGDSNDENVKKAIKQKFITKKQLNKSSTSARIINAR